ncbi:unnamed protein product [Caenorhabditis auriculariae]|uniref:Uncharacterized protein n=1 Tax=Caenorhabditis auriculariae TaxID=2777116 RepID=A0A8S1H334_9PELO|nr:unnamed protein product [Caenorhabditis auriculariae]
MDRSFDEGEVYNVSSRVRLYDEKEPYFHEARFCCGKLGGKHLIYIYTVALVVYFLVNDFFLFDIYLFVPHILLIITYMFDSRAIYNNIMVGFIFIRYCTLLTINGFYFRPIDDFYTNYVQAIIRLVETLALSIVIHRVSLLYQHRYWLERVGHDASWPFNDLY